ncbi:hypothetical protein HG530_007333 [Fusarium avenaceum]|nr:hypothetical protein HG530_007333 [Fusarium avenaceum]
MNQINQPVLVLDAAEELLALRSPSVHLGPLTPDTKRLLAPSSETNLLDNSRRNDLLAREHTPCHSVCARVGLRRAVHVIAALRRYKFGLESVPFTLGNEELYKRLLEDEAVGRAPAESAVVGAQAVDSGLRGDSPPSFAVELQEMRLNGGTFGQELLLTPWDGRKLSLDVLDE